MKTGDWVGGGYWANKASHPDHWGRPFAGQIIPHEDSRAWANTPEFPDSMPNGSQIMSKVLAMKEKGLLDDIVPVLWDFKTFRVVKWERKSNIVPYAEEMAKWRAAKAKCAAKRDGKMKHVTEYLDQQAA